jgi:hypothetical protein
LVKDSYVFEDKSRECSFDYTQLRKVPELLSTGHMKICTKISEKKFCEKDRFLEKTVFIRDMPAAQKSYFSQTSYLFKYYSLF